MEDSKLQAGGSETHNLYYMAMNVSKVSTSELNCTGAEPRIKLRVPQVIKPRPMLGCLTRNHVESLLNVLKQTNKQKKPQNEKAPLL